MATQTSTTLPPDYQLPYLKYGKLVEIPSVWGHRAGNPRDNPEDAAFIDAQVEALLND